MSRLSTRCCILAALLALALVTGCQGDSGRSAGRMALGLSGQFFTGELTSLDLFVYEAGGLVCDEETGALSDDPTNFVESATNVSLTEPSELTFELPLGADYIVYARAGQRDGGSFDVIAQGCVLVTLSQRTQVDVFLHRIPSCGDGDVDLQEMCDDNNNDDGDGCSSSCGTEPGFANDWSGFRDDRQYEPIAAGHSDLVAACWRSDDRNSQQAPMAWFDSVGAEGQPFLQDDDWDRRDCTDVDVRGEAVLMTFFLGTGADSGREAYLIGWSGSTSHSPIEVGLEADRRLEAAFVSETEIITMSQTPVGIQLRSVAIDAVGLTLNDTPVSVDDSSMDHTAGAIAGGDGDFVVAWQDGDNVNARFFNSLSAPSSVVSLCGMAATCSTPDVAALGGTSGDQYLVVYQGTSDQIFGNFIDMNGAASNEFPISTATDCREPVVAAVNDDDDTFIVAWTQTDGAGSGVFARVIQPGRSGSEPVEYGVIATGSSLSPEPFQVTGSSEAGYDQPAVATGIGTDDQTSAIVFYRDIGGINGNTGGEDSDIGFRLLRIPQIPSGS